MDVTNVSQGRQITLNLNANSTSCAQNIEMEQPIANQVVTNNGDNKQPGDSKADNGQKPASEQDVKKAVDKLNKLLEDKPTHVEYEIYGKFRDLTIRIVDNNTKEVIQELPPKKIIDMVDKLCELAGVFVDKKA